MNKAWVCGKRNSYVISEPFVLFNDKEQPNTEELNGGLKQQQNEVTTALKAKHNLNEYEETMAEQRTSPHYMTRYCTTHSSAYNVIQYSYLTASAWTIRN